MAGVHGRHRVVVKKQSGWGIMVGWERDSVVSGVSVVQWEKTYGLIEGWIKK